MGKSSDDLHTWGFHQWRYSNSYRWFLSWKILLSKMNENWTRLGHVGPQSKMNDLEFGPYWTMLKTTRTPLIFRASKSQISVFRLSASPWDLRAGSPRLPKLSRRNRSKIPWANCCGNAPSLGADPRFDFGVP